MPFDFYEFADTAIKQAVPPEYLIKPDPLPFKFTSMISHGFNTPQANRKAWEVSLFVLPQSFPLNEDTERDLIILLAQLIDRGRLVVVISEEESIELPGALTRFITRDLRFASAHSLWIRCCRNRQYKAIIDGDSYHDLHTLIRDIWSGNLAYWGPPGTEEQNVNLELMQCICPFCSASIKLVTGFVFPDRQLGRWDHVDWYYYNTLVPLYRMPGATFWVLGIEVEELRQKDPRITTVRGKYATLKRKGPSAAYCPFCHEPVNHHYMLGYRKHYLSSRTSRITRGLEYISFTAVVTLGIIDRLLGSIDEGDHHCRMGWKRDSQSISN